MELKTELDRVVNMELDLFLNDRTERFPNISIRQRNEWADNIVNQICDMIFDDPNDLFYNNMPEDVEETD